MAEYLTNSTPKIPKKKQMGLMRGILNINKPAGISSYDCIRQLKPLLKPKKIGHAGTLDPLASGVLLILVNEATKISRLLMDLPKEYEAEIRFGIQTDTDDITDRVINTTPVPTLTLEELAQFLYQKFAGEIEQIPPRFSALKSAGEPLYKLARKGADVNPKPRTVNVYEIRLLEWHPPIARIYARVSGGTYIRALCRDIGLALSSSATLSSLIRKSIGNFKISQAYILRQLQESKTKLAEYLVPIERALGHLPKVFVSKDQAQALFQGKIGIGNLLPHEGLVLAQTEDNRFLALVRIKNGALFPERIIYAD
ncbi:MAG: tRNA pseudouridine(55) synthase TruB [candidate division WOR-3 bacterium]